MEKNTNKDELLKAVADVLDEALQEYEKLAKMENLELAEDPTKPMMPKADESAEDEEGSEDDSEEESDEDKKKKKDGDEDSEDEESDEDLENAFKSLSAKMEKRGLKKSEATASDELKKTEAVAEDLRKSVDGRFEALNKTIQTLAETVNKIASTPARKGVSGLQPLRKNEEGAEAQPLNKAETVNKLLNLKKSGQHVDTALINRIETGRTTAADHASITKFLG